MNVARDRSGLEFLARLDRLTKAMHGLPNIIKDSRLPRSVVEACYPEIDKF